MLYVYDNAICEDLRRSLNPQNVKNPVVKVVDPDMAVDVASQISNDEFEFPAVVVTRASDYDIDNSRMNFSMLHRGVDCVFDNQSNVVYQERVLPITLRYNITILGTNTPDMDELTRELLFKYMQQYFLTAQVPYESKRKIRFGLTVDTDQPVESTSRLMDYLQSGKAYQNIVHLKTEGAVLVTYVGKQLMRCVQEPEIKLD